MAEISGLLKNFHWLCLMANTQWQARKTARKQ